MRIMQGDSYPIYIELAQDGTVLTPDMVAELEVCVGDKLRKLYTKNEVFYDDSTGRWYIHPKQQETLDLPIGIYSVIVRVKYKSTGREEVIGLSVGRIEVIDSISEEVI